MFFPRNINIGDVEMVTKSLILMYSILIAQILNTVPMTDKNND
jgi:hypothetical protein